MLKYSPGPGAAIFSAKRKQPERRTGRLRVYVIVRSDDTAANQRERGAGLHRRDGWVQQQQQQ